MKLTSSLVLLMTPVLVLAQQAAKHPDLSGTYAFYIDAAPVALKKVVNGKAEMRAVDQSARWGKVIRWPARSPGSPRQRIRSSILRR